MKRALGLCLRERLPQRPPYNEEGPGTYHFPVYIPFASGMIVPKVVCDGRILSYSEVRDIRDDKVRLYFIGNIAYWDDSKRARQTAFCRYLSFPPAHPEDAGRFEKDCDPDYEYQD
jgi:hypothetical protein